jgi:hypothetical protein
MNAEEINLDLIKTNAYRASLLSRTYQPFNEFAGFIKHKKEIILFSEKDIEKYEGFENVKVYHVSKEVVDELKNRYKFLSSYNYKSVITELDKEYFQMNGSANKEKRNVINKYIKNIPLEVQSLPNSIDEVKEFLKEWKDKRKHKYNEKMMFTGYDLNFVINYLYLFKENLISKFYYFNSKLVGMTIIEKVNDNFYNLLKRKYNPDFSQLCYFIDFSSFKEIFENSGKDSIILNLGVDGNDKGIHEYKTKKFPILMEIKTYNIKIDFTQTVKSKRS